MAKACLGWNNVLSRATLLKAVIFDYGEVIAFPKQELVIRFLCETFRLTPQQFAQLSREKHLVSPYGESDESFWIQYGREKKISLSSHWSAAYQSIIKQAIGVDKEMCLIIDDLKRKKIQVGLLSNIEAHWVKVVRRHGFHCTFIPCLLSCEIGVEKPHPGAFQILLKQMPYPAKEIVFIDDKIENVKEAKSAGLDAILFHSPQQIRGELKKRLTH